jgi:HlyD family type I secretion membrane fusion protein
MENSITKSQPTTLTSASVDQFLPPPQPWAKSIGRRIIIMFGGLVLVLAILPYEQTVRARGIIRPSGENTLVQSEQQGIISRVLIRANQIVKSNQILAVIDQQQLLVRRQQILKELDQVSEQRRQIMQQQQQLKTELLSNRILNQAQIGASKGDVNKADATLTLAQTEMNRYRELAEIGAVPKLLSQEKAASFLIASSALSQAQYGVAEQQAKLRAEVARLSQGLNGLRSQLAEQERQTVALKTQLAEVNRSMRHAAIRSPIEATVITTRLNHVGQVVNTGEVIAELSPLQAPMVAKAQIAAKDIGEIKRGQNVYLRIAACPYSRFGIVTGRITAISADSAMGQQDASKNDPYYELTISPGKRMLGRGNAQCNLKIGMDLQADVVTHRTTILGFLSNKLRLDTNS